MKDNPIVLEALKVEDKDYLYKWINNRDIVIYNSSYKPVSESEHERWFDSVSRRRDDLVIFSIREQSEQKTIGVCQLKNIQWIHRNAELQIRIGDKRNHGKGYGTIAVKMLCEFGFRDLNLHRIYLHVWSENERAIRTYENAGFAKEGVMQDAAFIDGMWVNIVIMAIVKN